MLPVIYTLVLAACTLQLRFNKVSELIHNSTNFRNLDRATVTVYFQEIIDKASRENTGKQQQQLRKHWGAVPAASAAAVTIAVAADAHGAA